MITEEDKQNYQKISKNELNLKFYNACSKGDLEHVKYLLLSPELKENADIHSYQDEGFIKACQYGHLDIVKYLMTSPELKERANIHGQNTRGFMEACAEGHLDIIEYLLTSSDLKNHAEIYWIDYHALMKACYYQQPKVIDYLVVDYNMNISKELEEKLSNTSVSGAGYARQVIEARDLKNKMTGELEQKISTKLKAKI